MNQDIIHYTSPNRLLEHTKSNINQSKHKSEDTDQMHRKQKQTQNQRKLIEVEITN